LVEAVAEEWVEEPAQEEDSAGAQETVRAPAEAQEPAEAQAQEGVLGLEMALVPVETWLSSVPVYVPSAAPLLLADGACRAVRTYVQIAACLWSKRTDRIK